MARRLPVVLNPEEEKAFLATFSLENPRELRDYVLCRVMLDAGLRCSEALNLRWEDVDFRTGRLHVRKGKGKKDRILWLPDATLELLKRLRNGSNGFVFCNKAGKRLSDRYVRKMVKEYKTKAGLEKDVHPHTLRHSFATDLLRHCRNLRIVQRALGHSSISTTEVYTHVLDEELEQAMKSLRG